MSPCRTVAVIPVLGQQSLTHAVLGDIYREHDLVDVLVIDNGGAYEPFADERVVKPPSNLGWLRATNLGLSLAKADRYDHAVILNNDTRLSIGFFQGLLTAIDESGAALCGPVYDDVWATQRCDFLGDPSSYCPNRAYRFVDFIDGTCILIPINTISRIGYLDEENFGRFGWGADLDYGLRAQRVGLTACVTERSYLHHIGGATARENFPAYDMAASAEGSKGLSEKYGPQWFDNFQAGQMIRRIYEAAADGDARRDTRHSREENPAEVPGFQVAEADQD